MVLLWYKQGRGSGSDSRWYKRAGKWQCFTVEDGTLRRLFNFLSEGPKGRREKALLEALQDHGLKGGFDGSTSDPVPDQAVCDESVFALFWGSGGSVL